MKKKINEKGFDCLINKWQAEESIYKETEGMTDNELIEYFKRSVKDSELDGWWYSLINKEQLKVTN